MPPPPGVYNSSFVVGGLTIGFDIRGEGYSSDVEANQTTESIPWAQTYSVVRHFGGINPLKRDYRIILWSESDFVSLASAVRTGNTGILTTPREGPVLAALDRVARGSDLDRSTATGMTTAEVSFTILQ